MLIPSDKAGKAADYVQDIASLQLGSLVWVSFADFLRAHRRYPIIAITGQAGVGKTTFTGILTKRLNELLEMNPEVKKPGIKLLTELPQMSPYLPIIKASKNGMADTVVWEKNQQLFLHLDQAIVTKAALESKDNIIVMDFAITQVQIYGDIQIKWKAGVRFRREFDTAFKTLPKPDIIVHVSASSDIVIDRLAWRGSYIDEEVAQLAATLNEYYNQKGIIQDYYQGVPIITVKTDAINLVDNPKDKMEATQGAVDSVLSRVVQ